MRRIRIIETIRIGIIAIEVRKIGIIAIVTGIIAITTGSTTMIARTHAIGTGIIAMLLGAMRVGIGTGIGSQIFEKDLFSRAKCDEPFDLCPVTCMPVLLRRLGDTVTS